MQTLCAVTDTGPVNEPMSIEEQALKIAHRLQTTLEIPRIVELFSEELRPLLPHDGIRYVNEGAGIEVSCGTDAVHECSYTLTLQQEQLGTATLTRNRPFTERETEQLEQLFVVLLYPLRNGLMYRQAVSAALTDPHPTPPLPPCPAWVR